MAAESALLTSLAADDIVVPFQIESAPVRGRVVRLGAAAERVLSAHAYPDIVLSRLGEALALTAMLGSALKFEGLFTLQAQGDGPLSLLVVDYETPREGGIGILRGYASFEDEGLAALGADPPLERLFGKGALALTVDPRLGRDRYQGIVPLEGGTLARCARHYFMQSEQIPTHVELAVARHYTREAPGGQWRAGGLMAQFMPQDGGVAPGAATPGEAERGNDDWTRVTLLAGTAAADELVDPSLPPDRLLYRLFHQEGVRVFALQHVAFGCRCARGKVANVLKSYPRTDLIALVTDGVIETRCEFCSTPYVFTLDELAPQE